MYIDALQGDFCLHISERFGGVPADLGQRVFLRLLNARFDVRERLTGSSREQEAEPKFGDSNYGHELRSLGI